MCFFTQFLWQLFLRQQCLRLGFKNLFLPLLFISASQLSAIAADAVSSANKITLQQALQLAFNSNPALSVVLREREAIAGLKTQAAVRPNPSLFTSVQDTRSANRQTTLQLSQEIELGNKRGARIEAADAFYSKATAELENQQAKIHANVIAAFYEVLAAQERSSLAKSSLEIASLALDAAAKRVKAGKSAPVEETKSRIAKTSAKIELRQASSQLNSSRSRLSALWGNASPSFESADGDIAIIPITGDLNTLSTMLVNAPAVKVAGIEVQAREMMTKVERTKATPNITLSAGFINNQELGGINQALIGFSVPIPIFDRNQGSLQEAVSRKYKAEDALVALKNQLSSHLTNQYERLNAAREASTSLKSEILPSAQSAFDAASKGYSAGKFNFLDVLDAQRTLFQAKTQYVQALLEAHLAIAEIERILGNVIWGDVISHQDY